MWDYHNKTQDNATGFQDVTRSVDQLCTHLSLSNIAVPRINTYSDVFDFIAEFELVTATLPEDQRLKVLVKAFPPGSLFTWFEQTLKPLIKGMAPWKTIRNKIIERYSDTEDRDRHFNRLQRMKFDPNGSQKLYDYVEDLCYTIGKALPSVTDEESKIRYVKANLPSQIKPSLSLTQDYNFAKNMEEFMRGIRQYDLLKPGRQNESQDEKVKTSELVTLLKDIFKGVKQEGEATRNVLATLQAKPREPSPQRQQQAVSFRREASPQRPTYHMNRERSVSPYNTHYQQSNSLQYRPSVDQQPPISNNYQNNYTNRNFSGRNSPIPSANRPNYNQYQQGRPPSPSNYNPISNQTQQNNTNQYIPTNSQKTSNEVFSKDLYFQKFGVPPSPCPNCQYMHWARHCHNNLN